MPENVTELRQPQPAEPRQLLPLHSCIRVFRQRIEGEAAWISGILLDASQNYLLLQVISDQITLNGYQIIRRRDISHIERPAPQQNFILKALALRCQTPRHPGIINMKSMRTILKSVSRLSPLITIHQEITDPSICWIGKIFKVNDDLLHLHCITPEAAFESSYDTFDVEGVTRIDFGGAYEDALWQVFKSS